MDEWIEVGEIEWVPKCSVLRLGGQWVKGGRVQGGWITLVFENLWCWPYGSDGSTLECTQNDQWLH